MDAFAPLAGRLAQLRGRLGACVANADGRELFARDPDALYPAASVIKLPLLMALHAEAARGAVSLTERVPLGPTADGTGVLRHLSDVADASLRDLAMLTAIVSDNSATNRLIERVGMERVNACLDAWGCPRSRLRRAMYEREAKGENEMTPRETARLLALLVRGELVDRATSDTVLDLLARNTDASRLRRYVPGGVWFPHKEGNVDRVRNDAGIVRVEGTVIVAGFCRDLESDVDGDIALGLLGWCAYRAAGGAGADLPPALERVV